MNIDFLHSRDLHVTTLELLLSSILLYSTQVPYYATVVRQAVLSKNHVVLAVLRFWSYGKGCGLLYVTCGSHIRKLVFL